VNFWLDFLKSFFSPITLAGEYFVLDEDASVGSLAAACVMENVKYLYCEGKIFLLLINYTDWHT